MFRMHRLALIALCAAAILPSSITAQSPDSVSVEETISFVLSGDRDVSGTLRTAAEQCAAGPDSWQHRLMERLVAIPPDSIYGEVLEFVVPAVRIGIPRCADLDVEGWILTALYKDMREEAYRGMARGLAGAYGSDLLRKVAADPDSKPLHRIWVTEALVTRPEPWVQVVGDGGIVDRMAEEFGYAGLAPDFVRLWVPMVLAAVQTREDAAQTLMRAVTGAPARMGAPDVLLIVATAVEAYDYRFSGETRSLVSDLLERLVGTRAGLPPDVAAALDSALGYRATKRNYRGVRVEQMPLQLELASTEEGCEIRGPLEVVRAVAEIAPDFRLTESAECRADRVPHGDFDGNGSQDALLRGSGNETILLVVLTGSDPRALFATQLRFTDSEWTEAPGTYQHPCDTSGPDVFENDYIVVSWNDKFTSHFRFTGAGFEELTNTSC